MCQIRDYQTGDEKAIFDLVRTVLEEYGLRFAPDATDLDLCDIGYFYHRNQGAFRALVTDDGRIVGSCGVMRVSKHVCELRKMYLAKECRGRGFGKKLMNDAIAVARELGYREMTLQTNQALKEAVGLYESFGFIPYESMHSCERCDLAMRKVLDGADQGGPAHP